MVLHKMYSKIFYKMSRHLSIFNVTLKSNSETICSFVLKLIMYLYTHIYNSVSVYFAILWEVL